MIANRRIDNRKRIVVIGNGMVGHRFCEKLVEFDDDNQYKLVTFCEEPRAAYDRVGLTQFFAHRDAEKLMIARMDWYQENDIELHIGDRASTIDRKNKVVTSDNGIEVSYDYIVMATGSYPFVPPVDGIKLPGVFVYRTIEDLQHIIKYSQKCESAAVIGGGLLGLEAAKAAFDLGLKTHVVEFASRLMPRQIDDQGSSILVRKIEELGVQVHLNKATTKILGEHAVTGMAFKDESELAVDMIIVSAGIRPRDDLARDCGIQVGERGGIVVDDHLRTSDPDIFAVGEAALHRGQIYGLVAPGYDMAAVVAANLTGRNERFDEGDLSTKLKLMGVDVASFGDYETEDDDVRSIAFEDPFTGVYKKLFFSADGTKLRGGILIGDASEYGTLSILAKSTDPLPVRPNELLGVGSGGGAAALGADSMSDDAQVCSCNNVLKGQICSAIDDGIDTLDGVKMCTQAGTGCGGCLPLVTDIFNAQMKKAGKTLSNNLCEHFAYSRQELFEIVKIKQIKTFDHLLASHGSGAGCEVCKPTIASILASLWNEDVMDHATLQDTNDRSMANMQRGGLYSVIPRIPGGEITPQKLIVLGTVARKYGLYSKITGGQRVDLFGAKQHELPAIWEELIDAGFESGHAYAKALRTVKSCVGSTWCRYGVQDSVGFAVRVENRYKGLRSPHKLKSAVSGCVRECAEAQCKDFGLIATENGWNLYVCGNGGSKPRHADLLAADIDEETAIKYIDRFLMYYVQTADKLTRTSVWIQKLEGGIEYLKDVVINDKLGIADELERQMQYVVDTYECEWKRTVDNPQKRQMFRQFVNSDENESNIELIDERGQSRPIDWSDDLPVIQQLTINGQATHEAIDEPEMRWVNVGKVWDFPHNGGAAIKYGNTQIAVFKFESRNEWYACQNMCPHRHELVLSRGIIGTQNETPKVACPLHKKTFSLEDGNCLSGDDMTVHVFKVKIDGDDVLVNLPPQAMLDDVLETSRMCNHSCSVEEREELLVTA